MIGKVTDKAFNEQLDRILQSHLFSLNPAYSRLLRYLAQKRLRNEPPSESQIAKNVYNVSWTPRVSNVRTSTTRLSDLLVEYYGNEGYADPVIFTVERYIVIAEPNPEIAPSLAQINEHSPDLAAVLTSFYKSSNQVGVHCVVTGHVEDVVWHHLDFDCYNSALCNRIPLHRRLWQHLQATRHPSNVTLSSELAPARLADELAPKHFRNWRVADAYACAALAFYLGDPAYYDEGACPRLLRLCDAIHYARHRFFEPLMHQIIQQMILPYLASLLSVQKIAAFRMAIQLTALLEETGSYEDAQRAFSFANGLFRSNDHLARNTSSRDAFVLARRALQLNGERLPEDSLFDQDLLPRAEEHVAESTDRELTLHVIRAHRWLRQETPAALERAHELLVPIIETHNPLLFVNNETSNTPMDIAAADLSEIYFLASITYSRLQPSNWKDRTEECITTAKKLMYAGGHILPAEYTRFLSKTSPSAKRLLRLSSMTVRPSLRKEAITNIRAILNCLEKLLIID